MLKIEPTDIDHGQAAAAEVALPARNIDLKNVKIVQSLSEETLCFSAALYVDGKRVCGVSNRGTGGADESDDWTAYNALDAWCKTALGEDLEIITARLLDQHFARTDLHKLMARFALYTKPGETGIFQLSYKGGKKPDAGLFAEVLKRHPDAVILNTLPEDEALQLYLSEAAQ